MRNISVPDILTLVGKKAFVIPNKKIRLGSGIFKMRQNLIGIGFHFLRPALSEAEFPHDEVTCAVDILKVDTEGGRLRKSNDIADMLPQGRYVFDAGVAQAILMQTSEEFDLPDANSNPNPFLDRGGTVAIFTSSGVMFLRHMDVPGHSWLHRGFQKGGMTFVGPTNILTFAE